MKTMDWLIIVGTLSLALVVTVIRYEKKIDDLKTKHLEEITRLIKKRLEKLKQEIKDEKQ